MPNPISQELKKVSDKVLFLYNLEKKRFDFLSQGAEQVLGLPQAEVKKEPALLLQNVQKDEWDAMQKRFEELMTGQPVDMTVRYMSQDHLVKYVSVEAQPIVDDSGHISCIAGMAADVTKEAEYEMYLIEYARRKDSVLAIIAHDLRAPLSNVKGAAELLKMEVKAGCFTHLEEYLSIIASAHDECLQLIEALLKDEHLKSPTIHVKKDRIDVASLVGKVLSSFRAADSLGIAFEAVSTDEKVIAELDEVKLMQILNNLVSNSIKFTPPGGKVTVTVSKGTKEVLITHSDTGIGIPKQIQPYIFERYGKAGREGLQGEGSHGVGLSIVRQLVEIQGGRIWLESNEGEGTTFFVALPLN